MEAAGRPGGHRARTPYRKGTNQDAEAESQTEAKSKTARRVRFPSRDERSDMGFNMRLLRPGRYEDRDDKFGLLLEAFVVALEKLPEPRRSSSAARMNRQLIQRCGRQGGDLLGNANAEALRAALVVFSEGQHEPLSASAEEWLEYWWTALTLHLGAGASDSGAASSTAPARARVVDLDSQGSGDGRTTENASATAAAGVGTGMWDAPDIGDTELSLVDRALQEERDMEEAKRQSREEASLARARAEVESQDHDFAEMVEDNTAFFEDQAAFQELRRLQLRDEEMARAKREAAEARLAKWVEVEEEKQRTRDLLRQKRLEEETDQLNCQLQAATYRDWEAWVVLNTPPTHGARTRSGYTLLEASVLQDGRPVAKKARWSDGRSPCAARAPS